MDATKATILVVDDEAHIRQSLEKALRKEGYETVQAADGRAALDQLREHRVDLTICDLRMPAMDGLQFLEMARAMRPEMEVLVMTGYGTVETAVSAMKAGAYDFIEKPFRRLQIVKAVEKALEKQTLIYENQRLKEQLEGDAGAVRHVIGRSTAMRSVMELVDQIADSNATVLITGESGTGKEVIANAIHHRSQRRDRSIVKVSCAALPETLLEAELFGYEKGAFTGATGRKVGRFELADQGTLFMDEVGEIPASMQVKLLRVLQEGEFERLGGTRTLSVDVRLVAATNRDLRALVEAGEFREDLFYRLNVINIAIPSLRERREDVPLLVDHFVQRFSRRNDRRIVGVSEDAMQRLIDYDWPGNVRELENTIERAIVLAREPVIGVEHLPASIVEHEQASTEVIIAIGSTMRDVENRMIDETLKHTNGNREMAARMLGIASRTIYRKLGRRRANGDGGGARAPQPRTS